MADEDKPFACVETDCGMTFTNEDHLAVHMRKHDMNLALSLTGPGMLSPSIGVFSDQTPTPTKFLKNLEEMGLFQELNKNPFDDSFKKAMDESMEQPTVAEMLPDTNDLDTPQPTLPRIVIGDEDSEMKGMEKAKDTLSSIVPKKRKKFLRQQSMPTSTTSEDESEPVIGSSSTEISTHLKPVSQSTEPVVKSPKPVHTQLLAVEGQVSSTQNIVKTPPTVVISAPSPAPVVTNNVVVEPQVTKPQQQAMVQVLLQLPGGQTIPVQVPASNIASTSGQVPVRAAPSGQVAVQASPNGQVTVQPQLARQNEISKPQIIQNVQQTVYNPNLSSMVVAGKQPVLQNMTDINQPVIVKPAPQANIPMTVRTITLGANQVQTNPQVVAPNLVLQDAKTVVTIDKQPVLIQQSAGTQYTETQTGDKTLKVGPPRYQSTGTKLQSGSQPYIKQKLKEAIQQQTGTAGGYRISRVLPSQEIKQEHLLELDNQGVVSSTGNVSSSDDQSYAIISGNDTSEDPEIRRKKFLERNRAAAARCRQKRKYWVTSLQSKADELTNQNSKLCREVKSLRDEVAQLKTLLLAHKDCPVTKNQRSKGEITPDTYNIEGQSDLSENHVIEISDNQPESSENTATTIPSGLILNSGGKPSTTQNTSKNVITLSNIAAKNYILPNILPSEGHVNGSTTAVNQTVVPQFLAVNPQAVQDNQETISVITGPNSIGLIPKLINIHQLVQGNSSQ